MLHPGPKAPPLGARSPDLGGKIGINQVADIDICRWVPREPPSLLTQSPDIRVLDLRHHGVRIWYRHKLFKNGRTHQTTPCLKNSKFMRRGSLAITPR
jgi:hypothetical protein